MNQITSNNRSFSILKISHKIFDSINISLLIFIFIFSFISISSQRDWTVLYQNLNKSRSLNNNLIDYISKTEEFYIKEIESLSNLKKTTTKDLIYLFKEVKKPKKNFLKQNLQYLNNGLKESLFQRGY